LAVALVHVGFGNVVALNRLLAIVAPDSAPTKRLMRNAAEHMLVIDATCGHKTKAVIVLDTGAIVLSALSPETIANRVRNPREQRSDRDPHADTEDE
jgi:extracellular matrix regulatory protein A